MKIFSLWTGIGVFFSIFLCQMIGMSAELAPKRTGSFVPFDAKFNRDDGNAMLVNARLALRRNSRSNLRLNNGSNNGLRQGNYRVDQEADKILGSENQKDELQKKLLRCLSYYFKRPESTSQRSPWGVMHAAIAFGTESQLIADGRKVNALGWLCWNGACRGQRLLYVENDKIAARNGPGLQGHGGQFLAILAQSKVKSDFPIKIGEHEFTVADLVEYEKLSCQPRSELTFKLIGLMHYLDSDETWENENGQQWSIPRLIQEELAQPIIGVTCGGTHRMMGFSYAVRTREKRGEEISGQWLRAKKFIESYHDYTFELQNRDGSFSTNFFEGRGDWGSMAERLESTGHILEWLVYSLPQDQLDDPRLVKAVNYLVNLMDQHRDEEWEIGPKGHALRGLVLYDQRYYGTKRSKPSKTKPVKIEVDKDSLDSAGTSQ